MRSAKHQDVVEDSFLDKIDAEKHVKSRLDLNDLINRNKAEREIERKKSMIIFFSVFSVVVLTVLIFYI